MKYKNILPIIASSLLIFTSCDDNLMEWGKDPDHGAVTGAELPLQLVEKIGRYEPLKNYTSMILGNGIGADLYMSDEAYRKIVNENFDEVTPGYAMKHGAMVKSDGSINFATIDAFIAKTKEAGLSVFGHTLVWHSNNNANYLNGIIAPTIIPGSSGTNLLNLATLKSGPFTDWSRPNVGQGITIENDKGIANGTPAIKLISKTTSSAFYDLQLRSPSIPVITNHNYEISFYIKSDQAGKGRFSFAGLANNYPNKDYEGTGDKEFFTTSSQWKQIKVKLNSSEFSAANFTFDINLGYLSNVTYYIDINSLSVVDLNATPVNLITNGNFETGAITPWTGWGGSAGSERVISAQGEGYGGTGYAAKVVNSAALNNYSNQFVYTLSSALEQGKEYTLSFKIKAATAASIQVQTQKAAGGGASYYPNNSVGTTWTTKTVKITPPNAETARIIFDLGEFVNTYYIDDITLTSGTTTGTEPITIEKTDAEKKQIIGDAMKDWVSKMMTHYKTSVFAWDVVNEPMKEDGTLRQGNEGETATDHFSWVKYLGKDYAVTAFKLARQYGNSTDKLFINDFNLESRLDKCDGLIEYVKYIESQGATVDGIGTQMHIGLTTDKAKIDQMFQKMAASGKLVKVSELDIRLGTKTPTVAQQASQAEMYQYVIDSYKKYVPAAQQYGITIWGVSDSEKEHEYWLPDESPNLWDANYARKHAYKGTADGLAGKDVSKDFSGELQK